MTAARLGGLAAILALSGIGHFQAAAQVQLLGCRFRADVHPTFPWTESAADIANWYEKSYRAAGLVRLWLKNTGQQPLTALSLKLGGEEYPTGRQIAGRDVVWWRLRPDPLPPGQVGQVEIRLRKPPATATQAEIAFDRTTLTVAIPHEPQNLRIERAAFTAAGEMVLWCSVAPGFESPPELWVDGVRAAGDAVRFFGPWHGVLGVLYRPQAPLEYGSFHSAVLQAADQVLDGIVIRARDDFYPLGTYGYVTPKEYAVNGLNLYVSFGLLGRGALDSLAAYGLFGVTPMAGGGFDRRPHQETLGHPAIWAYYLHDEPDCADYSVGQVPHEVRIGTSGMEMCARERNAYTADPRKLTYLTVDQTYKPANFFVYGPIADVCAVDHYPPPGKQKEIISTLEATRAGCGPQMLVFIFSAWWPEPKQPKEGQPRGRMWYADEERLNIAWAVAGGAQGLVCYIHCTEPAGDSIFHGAGEFPDVWHAIGQMYRQVGLVSPVLACAWPLDGAVAAPDGIFARALVGPNAAVIVAINDAGCQSTDEDFTCRPAKDVKLTAQLPPWLSGARAALVGEGSFEPLVAEPSEGKIELTVPELATARLILLAPDGVMTELARRYAVARAVQAEAVLRGLQYDLASEARHQDVLRRLGPHYRPFMAFAEAQGAYGMELPKGWLNPQGEKYNCLEWYAPTSDTEHWVQWHFKAAKAGRNYFFFQWDPFGHRLVMTVASASGREIIRREITGEGAGFYYAEIDLPDDGDYVVTLRAVEDKDTAARIARAAFLVPAEKADWLPGRRLR